MAVYIPGEMNFSSCNEEGEIEEIDFFDSGFFTGNLECGICAAPFTRSDVFVFWVAHTVMCFHASCASRLGRTLIADAREAELAGATPEPGEPPAPDYWANRLRSALRHRLNVKGN